MASRSSSKRTARTLSKSATKRPRSITGPQKAKFLKALCDGYSVTHAAGVAGHGRERWYELRRADEDFKVAWDEAIEAGTDVLEDEARRRALVGVDEPVTYQGQITTTYRKYSDTLLIFLLNGRRPERYKQTQRIEHTGPGGGPIQTVTVDALDAEIARLAQELAQRGVGQPVPVEGSV